MKRFFQLLASIVLLCSCGFVLAAQTEWLIVPGVSIGKIKRTTSEKQLIKMFGAENLKATQVDVGEGTKEVGTVLFPDHPEKSLNLLWKDAKHEVLRFVYIQNPGTKWRTSSGVTIGTSLKELEKKNKKPFSLAGFAWDYAGTITDFFGGELKDHSTYMTIRLSPEPRWQEDPSYPRVCGDRDFMSNLSIMRKFNPTVYLMILQFRDE